MSEGKVTDVIVLIPGFLGFDKLGKHSYFADTVGAEIKRVLPQPGVLIQPVGASPAGSLRERQCELLDALRDLVAKHGPDLRLHLVGHSTGGLDAELLTRAKSLAGLPWSDDQTRTRRAVRSIITVASPLAGTTLAASPLATFFGVRSIWDVLPMLRGKAGFATVSALLRLAEGALELRNDRAALDVLYGLLDGSPRLAAFVMRVWLRRALISDLRPEQLAQLTHSSADESLPELHRARVLTIAPKSEKQTKAGKLFDLFYSSTAEAAEREESTSDVLLLARALRAAPIPRIAGDRALLDALIAKLGPADNDGIVNTLRQLFPCASEAELAAELGHVVAFVLADHLDVVGYFPGNPVITHSPARFFEHGESQNGFLESGAHFRAPQLQELYQLVAREIQRSITKRP